VYPKRRPLLKLLELQREIHEDSVTIVDKTRRALRVRHKYSLGLIVIGEEGVRVGHHC
jgi:hypothetical protein